MSTRPAAQTKASLAGALATSLQARLDAAKSASTGPIPFDDFLTSPDFCGPYFGARNISATPIIRAIATASEGRSPDSVTEDESRAVFRCGRIALGTGIVPKVVVVGAGRRAGKTSNLLAPKAVHAAWSTPLPTLAPGEIARAVIIAPIRDQAEAAFAYCRGIVESSPVLRGSLAKPINTEEILLRRPDGRLVEIIVGAANRGGLSGRSRTLVFAGLDESCFFFADDGHTVNDRAIFDSAMGSLRFVPNGQCWLMSTPWIEGEGIMESFIRDHWGNPGDTLVAARVSSYALRGIRDDGSLRLDTDDDDSYSREILAIPMPRGSFGFFPVAQLTAALDVVPPVYTPEELGAGGDFAFERDCAAVAVVGRYAGGLFAPVLVEERAPSPGDDRAAQQTVRDFGRLVRQAGPKAIMADSHRRRFVSEYLHESGVAFVDAPGGDAKYDTYAALKRVIAAGNFALGGLHRATAEAVRDQLRMVTAKPKVGGGFIIVQPRVRSAMAIAAAGAPPVMSHLDAVSAIVLAAWMAGAGRTESDWRRPATPRGVARFTDIEAPGRRVGSGVNLSYLRSRSAGLSPRR